MEAQPRMDIPQNAVEQELFEQTRAAQQAAANDVSQPMQSLPQASGQTGQIGLTGGKQDSNAEYAQVAALIVDIDRRLRVLEERYGNLRKKMQLTDQNLLESERAFAKEIKHFNEELLELKRNTNEFSDKLLLFDDEMQHAAQAVDLKTIEKYLAVWNPANFVTRTELREYLRRKYGTDRDETHGIGGDSSSDDVRE